MWAKKLVDFAKNKNFDVLDLEREKANKEEVEGRLKKIAPRLVMLNGHGNVDRITGHDDKTLIKCGQNEKILEYKIVYAVSCKSAVILGIEAINSGCLSYIGYKENFIFCHKNKIRKPLEDKTAELFLEPSNQIIISLLKGNASGESCINSKKYSMRNIKKLLNSESSPETNQLVQFLYWNLKHQVCLGDENAKIE